MWSPDDKSYLKFHQNIHQSSLMQGWTTQQQLDNSWSTVPFVGFIHEVIYRSWHDPHSLSGCLVDNGCIVFWFISKSTCSIFEKPFMLVLAMHGSIAVCDYWVTDNQTQVNAVRHGSPLAFHYITPSNPWGRWHMNIWNIYSAHIFSLKGIQTNGVSLSNKALKLVDVYFLSPFGFYHGCVFIECGDLSLKLWG